MATYLKPATLDEALAALARSGARRAAPFAGCTDLMVRWKRGAVPRPEVGIDLKGIEELARIEVAGGFLAIGACATLSRIARDPLVRLHAPVLAEAAGLVACPQVRNRATIGGNLCNASPAADTALPLIVLDAVFDVRSRRGRREVPAAEFFRGPGATVLKRSELLAGVRIPATASPAGTPAAASQVAESLARGSPPAGGRVHTAFRKFGTRPAMEVALVSIAAAITFAGEAVARARIAFGSVAPAPLRGRATEACLEDRPLDDEAIGAACTIAMAEVSPISDLRASADYRRELVGILLRRMLEDARQL